MPEPNAEQRAEAVRLVAEARDYFLSGSEDGSIHMRYAAALDFLLAAEAELAEYENERKGWIELAREAGERAERIEKAARQYLADGKQQSAERLIAALSEPTAGET